jgi:hypothetical protein
MRLIFDDKNSLALKSLQEGIVDFADKRVEIKGAALAEAKTQKGGNRLDLFEVDLGELRSLQDNQVHIDEIRQGTNVEKGQHIVDDSVLDS